MRSLAALRLFRLHSALCAARSGKRLRVGAGIASAPWLFRPRAHGASAVPVWITPMQRVACFLCPASQRAGNKVVRRCLSVWEHSSACVSCRSGVTPERAPPLQKFERALPPSMPPKQDIPPALLCELCNKRRFKHMCQNCSVAVCLDCWGMPDRWCAKCCHEFQARKREVCPSSATGTRMDADAGFLTRLVAVLHWDGTPPPDCCLPVALHVWALLCCSLLLTLLVHAVQRACAFAFLFVSLRVVAGDRWQHRGCFGRAFRSVARAQLRRAAVLRSFRL